MNTDQDNQRLPVIQNASDVRVQPETAAQAVMGHLPETDSIDTDEKIQTIIPELDSMIDGGLITLEKANVIIYRPQAQNPS